LVRQEGGFEHLKRRFELIVGQGTGLLSIWEHVDAAGPQQSWAEVTELGELALAHGLISDQGTGPDSVGLDRFTWDTTVETCKRLPQPGVWFAVVLRWPPNLGDAHSSRAELARELQTVLWVVSAGPLGADLGSRWAVVSLRASEKSAQKAAGAMRTAGLPAVVLRYNLVEQPWRQ
jgi:hypothetical protein